MTCWTSHQIDEAKCEQIGFIKCPFDRTSFGVNDGRKAVLHNSGFGTVYGIVDGKPLPVCDYAGFAPLVSDIVAAPPSNSRSRFSKIS